MKKLLSSSFLMFSTMFFAQEQPPKYYNAPSWKTDAIVKMHPLGLLVGPEVVSYEQAVNQKISLGFGLGATTFDMPRYRYNNYGGIVFAKFYFLDVLDSAYLMASASTLYGSSLRTGYNLFSGPWSNYEKFITNKLSLRLGYQVSFNNQLVIDINLGAGMLYKTDVLTNEQGTRPALSGNLGLGYRF